MNLSSHAAGSKKNVIIRDKRKKTESSRVILMMVVIVKEREKVLTGLVNFAFGVRMLKLSQIMLYEAEECVEEDLKFVKAFFKTKGIVGSTEMLVLKSELC